MLYLKIMCCVNILTCGYRNKHKKTPGNEKTIAVGALADNYPMFETHNNGINHL